MDSNLFSLSSHLASITFEQAYNSHANFKREDFNTTYKRVYTKEIPGVSFVDVTINKHWVNRDKKMYLDVSIRFSDDDIFNERIYVDTDIYDKYSYKVKDGLLTITLYEIINEEPKFEQI